MEVFHYFLYLIVE